ncbi:hypothetical protein S7711_09389 [Stachybotrys chartarum IBT 7711]|uniref:Endonuclease III homolog n=1 Tax=Stachybotrys chartarum (strain CBS 109288 / IBT 7711) TaxID=1280523 RepID=A0A084AIT1_STACB|nr:hypothetical protein S7711_09389 [Stachybotrys chartarum IBT 7711]KFA47592.1 hypothetical protein S40293_07386 [Stachybotrys chartarum IBT 40293]
MSKSRFSKDTSKYFGDAENLASTPRRLTRSSLAQFAYAKPSSTSDDDAANVDIEDIGGRPSKKRRRGSSSVPVSLVKAEVVENDLVTAASPPRKTARKPRKPARTMKDATTGEAKTEPPSDWEAMYDGVKRMRAPGGRAYGAAVDTMGCERLADRQASPKDQRFHTLVSLMLSSQTKDTVNAVVMRRLQTEMPAHKPGAPVGLNLENMLAVDPKLLNEMIWAVGFHNNKTKYYHCSPDACMDRTNRSCRYLKQAADILRDKWNGDIPDTIEGLTSLPGVGPKMAYLCMSVAWNRTEGIGVDVHVHRITNLWGWNKTKNPEETRLALQSWLPHDRWREINHMLVGFGQTICLPVGRKCGECDLGLDGLCKAAERKKVLEGRKIKQEVVVSRDDGTVTKKEEVKHEVKVKEEVVNEDVPEDGSTGRV